MQAIRFNPSPKFASAKPPEANTPDKPSLPNTDKPAEEKQPSVWKRVFNKKMLTTRNMTLFALWVILPGATVILPAVYFAQKGIAYLKKKRRP
jgi:hypothetical protein